MFPKVHLCMSRRLKKTGDWIKKITMKFI